MTEEKEVKKGESKVADAAWLRDTAERHRAFAGNSGGWFIGRTFTIDDFRDDEEKEKKKKEWISEKDERIKKLLENRDKIEENKYD